MSRFIPSVVRAAHYPTIPNDPTLPKERRGRDDMTRIVLTCQRSDDRKLIRVEVPAGGRRQGTLEYRKLSGLAGLIVTLELDDDGEIIGAILEDA